jgi:hypothetical protein
MLSSKLPAILASTGGISLLLAASYSRQPAPSSQFDLEREAVAIANLPSLEVAQKTAVVRIPGFLSSSEADALLALIDDDEIRSEAAVKERDAYGVKHGNIAVDAPWCTTYLHSSETFMKLHKEGLVKKLKEAALATSGACEALGVSGEVLSRCVPRTIEIHVAGKRGGLVNPKHFDGGSQVTFDILLTDSKEFEGGSFTTLEAGGDVKEREFEKGDLIMFASHKYHTVQKITKGRRATFVMELWEGDERTCSHRCCKRYSVCDFSKADVLGERMMGAGLAGDE